ncbi:sulfite exporter TauE/SafE family protein [Flavobacterium agrisoli]|uniref:Probable membrane transporter protein n=1 Tax=Flavobacterium agrisoli TaxID=2793066 RepID=A0A934PNQ0_9FLAO|nr:sulfite exporter TauE/SafE family protein [Flavobacterium agrisoli]MBK0370235.1 sulfite exporter TauE/SafE family protein [Flavobacterium agrisoli]
MEKIRLRHISIVIVALKLLLISVVIIKYLPEATAEDLTFDQTFFWFLLAGFLAQIVDGALGMAYGVTSNSVLLSFGLSPKLASAAVHTAEVFTTGVSGLSHIKFGNFNKALFLKLIIPGVLSAVVGAYLLGSVVNGDFIKPYVNVYLLFLGGIILYKAFRKKEEKEKANLKNAPIYALFGGFLDAIGGGGWGPIVTSNLISQRNSPGEVIGTVNTAEFFVTYFSAGVLIYFTGIQSWEIILGLIVGGTLAAPFGAYVAKKLPTKIMMVAVGILIILTSLFTLSKIFLK